MGISVDDLYNYSTTLSNAQGDYSKLTSEFQAVLAALKGSSNEKRLASQITASHWHHFPQFTDQVLESLFDLCEDEDVLVRKQSIKDLTIICKKNPSHCQKVSDILVQMLQSTDHLEVSLVQVSLMSLMRLDAKATLAGLFGQILEGEEVVREKGLSFLSGKIKVMLSENLLSKDQTEEFLVTHCKKILEDVNGSEFEKIMKTLSSLPSLSSLQGRQQLVDLIAQQANLSQTADMNDQEKMNCFVECLEQATSLFSKNVKSDSFVETLCLVILPKVEQQDEQTQLLLFKLLAQSSLFVGTCKQEALINLYNVLMLFLPQVNSEAAQNEEEFPQMKFSHIESLLFSFHQLAKFHLNFLAGSENAERLKDFRGRLQYIARASQAYNKTLKTVSGQKTPEEKEVRQLALKTTNNIGVLIKDLFHNPPQYKAHVALSFKDHTHQTKIDEDIKTNTKRPHIRGPEDGSKRPKGEQARYAPPGGKYSSSLGQNKSY